jgi:hypothetical protein
MADDAAAAPPAAGGNSAILLAQSRLLSRRCHSRVESLLTWRTSLASAVRTQGTPPLLSLTPPDDSRRFM